MPYFSIVIPVYNRESLVRRAITSCLTQTFNDYEVIVVDDGSSDRSVEVARGVEDERIVLLRHGVNRGVCPARNTGVRAARSPWIIFLDSDDELLPGALETIHRRTLEVEEGISRLVFMLRTDAGKTSPSPPLTNDVWDYVRYIRWTMDLKGPSDFSNCIRAETFKTVILPENRGFESVYHLDFAKCYKSRTFPDVVACAHSDAENRSCRSRPEIIQRNAPDNATAIEALLDRHGTALLEYGPDRYFLFLRMAATFHFLSGNRRMGFSRSIEFLRRRPMDFGVWAMIPVGALGPTIFLQAYVFLKKTLAKVKT